MASLQASPTQKSFGRTFRKPRPTPRGRQTPHGGCGGNRGR
nr:MAG TPA: hypothetical protein [Caudoviricetes sp.]